VIIAPKQQTRRWCLLFGLHFAASLLAQPRDIRFEHISVEQGLSNYALTRIVQDQQGFLWFGTEDGLNKYDGYNFTVYKPNPADSGSLPGRFVQTLYVDREGNMWVSAGYGLCRYNLDTDKFDPHQPDSLAGKIINVMLEDGNGELWLGTNAGLFRYNRQRGTCVVYLHNPQDTNSLSNGGILALCEDRMGSLWVGTSGGGVNRFDRQKNAFIHYRFDPHKARGLDSDFISCIREDHRGTIWIGTSNGLNRYDRGTDTISPCRQHPHDPQAIFNDLVFDIYEDSRGTLWIGTFHWGLWQYEATTNQFFQCLPDPNDPYSLSEERISCIYEDRSGVLWFGTYRHGLNRYDRRQDVFARYKTISGVYAVWQDRRGELWVGTDDDGLLRFDRQGKCVRQYRQEPQNPDSLSTNGILAIYEDRRGGIWIGTKLWLHYYDARHDHFVRYLHEPVNPKDGEQYAVKTIYEDAAGEIWIGTNGSGLCRLDRSPKTFAYYRHDPLNPRSLSSNNVWTICEGRDGTLWVGTFGAGLNRFDRKTQAFARYINEPNNQHSLNNNAIYSLYADPEGQLWIGAWGNGLNRLDLRTNRFAHYTERDGLPDNFVKSILPDGHGNLWLSTDKGLSKFDPKTETFKNFTVKDGLISNQFLSSAYYKSADGRMFFGGEGGMVAFHPDSIRDNPYIPPVVITRFKVFDKPLPRQRALSSLKEIQLSYRQNFFSFEFVALDYAVPANNQYAYKLEGFDPDWVNGGTRRYASYTNVDPGHYVFRVKGANSDGVWNEAGASIKITITPPFWETWWFRALAFVASGLFIWGAYRYCINRLLEMERLRTRLAADLHDDIVLRRRLRLYFQAGHARTIARSGGASFWRRLADVAQDRAQGVGDFQKARAAAKSRL
jgi:ligand-binding sensor domain-containing protein